MESVLVAAMKFASHVGSWPAIVVLLVLLWAWKPARRFFGPLLAIGTGAAAMLGYFLKRLFDGIDMETIAPFPEVGAGFPSGHALGNMALYTLMAITILRGTKNPKKEVPFALLLLLMPVLIGVSRARLGLQYPGNVLAGWMVGFLVALIVDACKQFCDVTREIRGEPPS